MRKHKKLIDKKAHRLPLASMSANWKEPVSKPRSGKNRSQEVIAAKKQERKKKFYSSKKYQK